MSWVTMESAGRSFTTTFFTPLRLCPPTPTYTLAMSVCNEPLSLFMMLVRACAVLSMLYTTPLRIQALESSLATERTVMLPSGFFFPAMPVILDEPSSIATMKSFAISISNCFLILLFGFRGCFLCRLRLLFSLVCGGWRCGLGLFCRCIGLLRCRGGFCLCRDRGLYGLLRRCYRCVAGG